MQMIRLFCLLVFVCLVARTPLRAQDPAPPRAPATLTGLVRDSAGNAIADVEVFLRGTAHATRTNVRGEFTLAGVAPDSYRAFFRRLGYGSIEFRWSPGAGERTEVTVALERVAQGLDPVIVRAEEDKRYAANASIAGIVVDSLGVPLEEAEVQVIGAKMAGMTRANGGFLFRPLAVGPYVLRVRKLGYTPVTLTVERVEEHKPPDWPGNEIPKQMHLDLAVDDLDTAVAAAVALGAVQAEVQTAPAHWRVLLDPVGHPFCLSTVRPD